MDKFLACLHDILVIIGIPTAVFFFVGCVVYGVSRRGKHKIPFRTFRALYAMNPDRWYIWTYGSINAVPMYCRHGAYMKDEIHMQNFIDHLRYLLFAHKVLRIERKQNLTQEFEKIAASWQEDINSYRSDAAKELRIMQERLR